MFITECSLAARSPSEFAPARTWPTGPYGLLAEQDSLNRKDMIIPQMGQARKLPVWGGLPHIVSKLNRIQSHGTIQQKNVHLLRGPHMSHSAIMEALPKHIAWLGTPDLKKAKLESHYQLKYSNIQHQGKLKWLRLLTPENSSPTSASRLNPQHPIRYLVLIIKLTPKKASQYSPRKSERNQIKIRTNRIDVRNRV